MLGARRRLAVADLDRQHDVLDRRPPREQGRLLEHHADVPARSHHGLAFAERRFRDDGGCKPAMILSRVDFPHPLGPMIGREGALPQRQIDLVERLHVAPGEGLAHAAQFVHRPAREADRCNGFSSHGQHRHQFAPLFQASTNWLV